MNQNDIQIENVQIDFEDLDCRTPLKFGGKVLTALSLLNVSVRVRDRQGKSRTGNGSMILGNTWSFPSDLLNYDETLNVMKELAKSIREIVANCSEFGHPVGLMCDLEKDFHDAARKVSTRMELPEPVPKLCTLVVASPFDAALHDAYGRLHERNVYNLYGSEFMNRDLAFYLNDGFSGEYLDQYTLREPKSRMPLYHLVGALDPLTESDIEMRIDDGLPNTLSEWIEADGLTHMKIKMNGNDLQWDVQRVLAIDRVASQAQIRLGVSQWFYSVDFNEKCPNVQYILEFFAKIKEANPACFDRIQYVEQPTSRYLTQHSGDTMHEAAKVKPIVIDEALVDFEHLVLSIELGYSGVALKTCKGHSHALLMAAAALKYNLFLCVQDLTLVGESFLHSVGLCARVPGVAALEGNGRQYLPKANRQWETRWPSIFSLSHGTVGTSCLTLPGLGHNERKEE